MERIRMLGRMVAVSLLVPVTACAQFDLGGLIGTVESAIAGSAPNARRDRPRTSTPDVPAEDPPARRVCEWDPPLPTPLTGSAIRDYSRVQITPDYSLPDWAARDGWYNQEDYSACGLIAAETLLRYKAKDPGLDEIRSIRDFARSRGLWSADAGMCGADCEKQLLDGLGVPTEYLDARGDLDAVSVQLKAALDDGRPVVLSTTRHYFVVQGYDGDQFYVGHTGEAMRFWGKADTSWSLEEIDRFGQGLGAMYVLQPDPDAPKPRRVCHREL